MQYYTSDSYAAPVAKFMSACGQDIGVPLDRDTPTSLIDLRLRLMDEELSEVFEAINMRDPAQTAHELADLLFVVFGTAVAFGVPIDEVYAAVSRANLSKIDPSTGRPFEVDPSGKVRKGPDYHDPKVAIDEIMRTKVMD